MEKSLKTELAISWLHVIWSKNIRPKDTVSEAPSLLTMLEA